MVAGNNTYRGVVDVDGVSIAQLFLKTPMIWAENSTNIEVGGAGGVSCIRTNNGGQITFQNHVQLVNMHIGPNGGDDTNSIIQMAGSDAGGGEENRITFFGGFTAWSEDFATNGNANNASLVEDNTNNASAADFIWIYGDGDTNVDSVQFGGGVSFPKNGPTLNLINLPTTVS